MTGASSSHDCTESSLQRFALQASWGVHHSERLLQR
jgi:hypothetical protein